MGSWGHLWDPGVIIGVCWVPIGFLGSPLGAWGHLGPIGKTGLPKMLGTPYSPGTPPRSWESP